MRIAQISYHTCPLASEEGKETGGMNVYVYNLSLELAKMGHQIDVFTRSEDARAKKIVQVYPAPKARGFSGAGVSPNFRVIHLPAGPEKTLPKKELIKYIPEFSKNLAKFVGDYDILHAHYYMSGMAIMSFQRRLESYFTLDSCLPSNSAGKRRNDKLVVTFHTLALLKNLIARSEAEAEPAVRVAAEMELAQKVDKIIAPSSAEREYLHYFYGAADPPARSAESRRAGETGNKIEIIPPGFDPQIFHPINKNEARRKIGADPKHKIILFVGRIEPLKGLDVLMYTLKILVQKCSECPICLWIVGGEKNENPELQKLYDLRDALKLHSSIKFVEQQHQHELALYYNAADVVVMPSHYESFGMSALEAMACGTPVITTNVTGISTMFENDGQHTVISANNPLQLAEAIEKIINRCPSLWARRKKVQDFTWEKMAGRMAKVYEKLTRSSHRSTYIFKD